MSGSIFIIQNDDTLVEMTHQPYATEDHLQRFLERYPALLAGDQAAAAAPRRWLLVAREMSREKITHFESNLFWVKSKAS